MRQRVKTAATITRRLFDLEGRMPSKADEEPLGPVSPNLVAIVVATFADMEWYDVPSEDGRRLEQVIVSPYDACLRAWSGPYYHSDGTISRSGLPQELAERITWLTRSIWEGLEEEYRNANRASVWISIPFTNLLEAGLTGLISTPKIEPRDPRVRELCEILLSLYDIALDVKKPKPSRMSTFLRLRG
jgi:hypothetical protein